MNRIALACMALALAGCVSAPRRACVAPETTASVSMSSQAYTLAGRVISLGATGKISAQQSIKLTAKLQKAQADIRAGKTAEAQALIDSVKGELP